MPVPQLLQLADDLKPWAPVAVPVIMFGVKQAQALAKRFQEHYKHDAPETREQALQNGADAAQRIRDEVNARVERGELTEEQAQTAFQRPDIAKHTQDALLAASETPDSIRHEELAKLIGARLVAGPESRQDILLRMACDQLQYLNSRQLRILGLTFAVLYMQADVPHLDNADESTLEAAYRSYLKDVEDTVTPFKDLSPPRPVDFMHFEELGLAKLSRWSSYMGSHTSQDVSQSSLLGPYSHAFYVKQFDSVNTDKPRNPTVQWIHQLMEGNHERDEYGFKAAKLTPVGYVLGYCMYCIAHGQPFDLRGDWIADDQ